MLNELRYAARSLRKSPGFTVTAVLTFALGVGANTAGFTLVNSVLLRPLPYEHPDGLVLVWESAPFFGVTDSPVAPANYVDWKARSRAFEEMGAMETRPFRATEGSNPEVLEGALVSASLLRTLGIRPRLGRGFRDEEDRPGASKVAIISHSLWRRRFAEDGAVIGKTMTLNDEKYTIVGVLAPGNELPTEYGDSLGDVWAPFGTEYDARGFANRGRHDLMVVARLREGVGLGTANDEMKAIGLSLAREYPDTNSKVGAFVAPMREHFVGSKRRILLILLGTVTFVLLISCTNLANLLLSRVAARGKEMVVRAALGARVFHLVRQAFWESLLLCIMGSALGLWLATFTFRFLAHLAPGTVSGMKELTLDWRVLGYTGALSVLTAFLFGLVPVFLTRRLNLNDSLKQGGRTLAASSVSPRLRMVLISSEVALAFVLLTGAALLIRTFANVRYVDIGCRTQDILTLNVPPSDKHREPGQAYQREILRRVQALPGVVSAGFSNHVPVAFKGDVGSFRLEGHGPDEMLNATFRMVTPEFTGTLGIPLRKGRLLDERDTEAAPKVALINEACARMAWPNDDPVGRRITVGDNIFVTIAGVVGDIRQAGLDAPPKPELYFSALQIPVPASALVIRTKVPPLSIVSAVRQTIWQIDPAQPISAVATMEQILDDEVFERRLQTSLLAVFAALALFLAGIGLYGVVSYSVGQKTAEIGVRMALGADASNILLRTVADGVKLAVAGLVAGVAGALALSRVLSSFLFGVAPTDPATYVIVAVLLLATAALASYVPARRAMKVDPMRALRQE